MAAGALAGGVLMTIHRLSFGGADRVAILLANGFAAHGLPTALTVLRGAGEGEGALTDLLSDRVCLDHAGPPIGSRHLELVRGLFHIRRQIRIARPAIVLASSSNMGLVTGLCARLARGRRPRFVMKLTNPVIRPRDRGPIVRFYRRALYRFIFASYDSVIVLSDAERRGLSDLYPGLADRFAVLANPYISGDMLADRPAIARIGPASIVTAARMMPQKRLDRLLRAFALVTDRTCRLIILGDGPGRGELEHLAGALGIADRIDMRGFVTDVAPTLRASDLLVLSSDYEGLPAVIFEALACNVPVVSTDCFAGAREILADLPGCAVVAREDVFALARAIDASLATRGQAAELRGAALPYAIDSAIAAHRLLLSGLIGAPDSAPA